MRTHHSQLTLNRLSSRNVREMVALWRRVMPATPDVALPILAPLLG